MLVSGRPAGRDHFSALDTGQLANGWKVGRKRPSGRGAWLASRRGQSGARVHSVAQGNGAVCTLQCAVQWCSIAVVLQCSSALLQCGTTTVHCAQASSAADCLRAALRV